MTLLCFHFCKLKLYLLSSILPGFSVFVLIICWLHSFRMCPETPLRLVAFLSSRVLIISSLLNSLSFHPSLLFLPLCRLIKIESPVTLWKFSLGISLISLASSYIRNFHSESHSFLSSLHILHYSLSNGLHSLYFLFFCFNIYRIVQESILHLLTISFSCSFSSYLHVMIFCQFIFFFVSLSCASSFSSMLYPLSPLPFHTSRYSLPHVCVSWQ